MRKLAGTAAAAAAAAACLPTTASAWALGRRQDRATPLPTGTCIALAAAQTADQDGKADDDSSSGTVVNVDNVEPRAVYGVSYIGGDPCGSKYNDDPFDAAAAQGGARPGMPDDAKERIRLLAEKMKRKQQQQQQQE